MTRVEARDLALAANPALQALAAQVNAAAGAFRQSGAFANPDLVVESEDFGGDRPPDVTSQRTLSFSQAIEWPGKRSARREAAGLARDVATRDLERARRDVLAEVDRRFATLLGAQQRLAITAENARTAREVSAAVAALVGAGEVSPIEESRAQGDEALAAIDQSTAERDVDIARRALALLWGEEQPASVVAAGELAHEVALPAREEALAALATLPDVRRWDLETSRQVSLVTLASRLALPDLALSVGTRSYSGSDGRAWVAGVAVPLPLFTQFAGARAEASARLEQVKFERRAEEVRLSVAFVTAHETLARAISEVRTLRDDVVPRATNVYDALNEGYRRGKFRLLDLLEARRSLAASRLRYLDALVRLNIAEADLRRLIPDARTSETGAQQ
ncbi:MAG: TolC family protein [Acidobacteria bacterium]|nr:TolC family protein [Acidobacteriota bacterium]